MNPLTFSLQSYKILFRVVRKRYKMPFFTKKYAHKMKKILGNCKIHINFAP